MDIRTILLAIVGGALFWLLLSGDGAASSGSTAGVDCVASYQSQYSGQWAEMNVLQRLAVGLAASGCQEVQP